MFLILVMSKENYYFYFCSSVIKQVRKGRHPFLLPLISFHLMILLHCLYVLFQGLINSTFTFSQILILLVFLYLLLNYLNPNLYQILSTVQVLLLNLDEVELEDFFNCQLVTYFQQQFHHLPIIFFFLIMRMMCSYHHLYNQIQYQVNSWQKPFSFQQATLLWANILEYNPI